MALIPINVTITAQEPNSGPLYDVYYSTDGLVYVLATSGSQVNLPDPLTSAVVYVEDTYCRIRLVDASAACEGTTNTIDFGLCCSPEPNPVLSLEYEGYTSGSLIWSSSDTSPKSSSVTGGLSPAVGLQAWEFNGTSNAIGMSSSSLAGMTNKSFTINIAATFPSSSTRRGILGNPSYTVSADAIIRYDVSASQMALDLRQTAGGTQVSRYLMPVNTSSLQMVSIRQDGSNAVEVLLNGNTIPVSTGGGGTGIITGSYRIFNNLTGFPQVYFGFNSDVDTDNYNGNLSDIRIYSRSLSNAEILDDYIYYVNNCVTPTTTTTTTTSTSTTTQAPCFDYYCGSGSVIFTTGALNYGIYPTEAVCASSNECGTFVYSAYDRPNRFSLYDASGLVATSGWVGYADYSGPWGSDLNVSPNGSFPYDFGSTSGRYVQVEYGNADPLDPLSDSAEWSLTCGTCATTTTTAGPQINQYRVTSSNATFEYQNRYNVTETATIQGTGFLGSNTAIICAYSGSIVATDGTVDITYLQPCPGNILMRFNSTNAQGSKSYTFESSSGEWIWSGGSGPTSFDLTRCVTSQSGFVYGVNVAISNLGVCGTTTTTTTAAPVNFDISQSCYQNDGVVKIYNPTGGGGTYEFNNIAYFNQFSALAATTGWVSTGSITFNDMPDGTLWYALRDAANTSNIIAKSAVVNCNTSSNDCYTSASFTVGGSSAEVFWIDCCGNGSSSFFDVGDHIISGCISVGSISSPYSVGNPEYFGISCSCLNPTTTTTTTTIAPVDVIGVGGYMQPCVGGTIDDYMGASVTLNNPVNVDTQVVVDVKYVYPGNSCGFSEYSQLIFLNVPSGSTSDDFNACTNGIYFSGGANICSACV